jgi:tetratricopeptide (TPR) repeat protein
MLSIQDKRRFVNRTAASIQRIPLWVLPLLISALLFFPVKELVLTEDGALYMSYALNVYTGRGFVDTDWLSPVYRGRLGLPTLMAVSFWLFDPSPSSAFLATRTFFVLTALLMYFLGEKLYGKWVGLVTSLLMLTSVSLNEWSAYIHLDYILPFFMLLFLLLTFLALDTHSYPRFALAGAVLGLGCLVKEIAMLFAPLPVMALVLVKAFRCRKNLLGVLLLMGTLVLIVLPQFGFSYFGTTDIQQTAGAGALTALRDRLARYNANVEPLTVWRYLRAFVDYYALYLKPNFDLAPLMVVAWGFSFVAAAMKRHKSYLIVCSAGLLLMAIVLVQGTSGYRVRQGIMVFLFSYLILADFLVEVGKYTWRKLNGWVKRPEHRGMAMGAGALFACAALVFQVGFEEANVGTMQSFIERYNTLRFLAQKDKSWQVQRAIGEDRVRQAGKWLRRHAPPGSAVLVEESLRETIYFHAHGEVPLYRLVFPDVYWYLEKTAWGEMPAKTPGSPYYTPLFFEIFTARTRHLAQEDLSVLLEEYLLNELQEKSINYIITTPKTGYLALYLMDNPGFQKVADFDDGMIQIFKVDDIRPSPSPFETHVGIDVPAFLRIVQHGNPERYQLITENFFGDCLGWRVSEIQKVLDRDYPTVKAGQTIGIDDYVKLCQSRSPDGIELAIAQYQWAAELNPGYPWPRVTLGALYLARGEIEEALAAYQQAIAASPGDPRFHLHLAKAYLAEGEMVNESEAYEKALETYRQAFALAPDNPQVHDALVEAYPALGDQHSARDLLAEVIATYEKAIELKPDNVQTYWRLAEVYETLDQMDEAIGISARAVERWPKSADAHFRLGQAYEAQAEIEKAIAEYKRAIELKPTLARAYIPLGNLYKDQNRAEEAVALYQAASKKNPHAAWAHIELGKIYLEQANSQ